MAWEVIPDDLKFFRKFIVNEIRENLDCHFFAAIIPKMNLENKEETKQRGRLGATLCCFEKEKEE